MFFKDVTMRLKDTSLQQFFLVIRRYFRNSSCSDRLTEDIRLQTDGKENRVVC